MIQTRPTWAEISSRHLTANFCELRRVAAPDTVIAIVKANAYGHGVLACAPLLASAGAEWLGVTSVEEAVAVRAVCSGVRLLVMSSLWRGEADAVIEYDLTPQVWEPFHIELLDAAARSSGREPDSVAVHLEIDTGMSRQGTRGTEALDAILDRIERSPAVRVEGVMTHFSSPEELEFSATQGQIRQFGAALAQLAARGIRPEWVHAGNSATLLSGKGVPALRALAVNNGARLMLRPGLALYGYPARFTPSLVPSAQLTPVLAWKTRVISLRTMQAGETAGYNDTFQAQRETRLALLPVGYADGYNRLLSNRGLVLVRGRRAPVAGRISMDQTTVDVTGIADVEIGDEVVLIGRQGSEQITAYDLADWSGTIPYEVLCGIGARVPRKLVE